MDEALFRVLVGVALGLFLFIRVPFARKSGKAKIARSMNPKKEKILVGINFVTMAGLPLVYVFSEWIDSFAIGLDDSIRLFAGGLFILGLVLFLWSHKSLGTNWSNTLDIKKNHALVKEGPYKFIRHPMYAFFYLYAISIGLMSSNWLVLIAGFLCWTCTCLLRIGREEKMLAEEFGQEYRDYMKKTRRLVPFVY
jgi:protein-S-isoprenylcysteine O-methyltransferase Ste14